MTANQPPPDDDKTVLLRPLAGSSAHPPLVLSVTYPLPAGGEQTTRFTRAFRVGRAQDCEVRIAEAGVSRQHVEIYPRQGQWWARDLQSRNGTYLDGKPIEQTRIQDTAALALGHGGPLIQLRIADPTAPEKRSSSAGEIAQRYFDPAYTGPAGEHTLMVREAFQQTSRKQSRRYWGVIGFVLVLFLGAASVAVYQRLQLQKSTELAVDIFYAMKTLELELANLEATLDKSARIQRQTDIAAKKLALAKQRELAKLREKYQQLLTSIRPPEQLLDDEERIILRIAQVFGECELNMPDGFMNEVSKYIKKWQSTDRFKDAIQRLKDNNYGPIIQRALAASQLPPQFMYLGMQESNFRKEAVGPRTRYGHAKGMWQFIPATGIRYGLRPGPLQELGKYDPRDERHDVKKSTIAAGKYLKDIYRTDAQASGLLVMASYNWGEGNIIKRIRKMPENPRERNFWNLLKHHKIPEETYDYVFHIVAAAVIGENPRLFGFDFDNPLTQNSPEVFKPGN
jgi:pSer/pThr/pTyr-binding forkhead associated (FHA) protein